MTYTVIAPLVVMPHIDGTSGDGYFYADAIIPDGYNDERCKELAEDGMLEKVKATAAASSDPAPDTVEAILAEVGDDQAKAAAALEAENAKDKPRSTLVSKLEAIANPAS